jgi:hypothetical protein
MRTKRDVHPIPTLVRLRDAFHFWASVGLPVPDVASKDPAGSETGVLATVGLGPGEKAGSWIGTCGRLSSARNSVAFFF